MCLFQDLALYALAMKMFKNNSLCFPEPRTLRTNHQVVYILYVSISRPRTLRTSPYLGQIGSDQSDQSIYGIRRTGQTILWLVRRVRGSGKHRPLFLKSFMASA